MGRKSLLASTTKKKTKKKKTAKKSVKASAAKKSKNKNVTKAASKAVAKKTAAKVKKTTAAKPKTTAKRTTAPAKPKAKTTAKKKAPATKKKATLKELVFKAFVLGKGQNKVAKPVKIKKKTVNIPEAPPFVTGFGKKETERIRGLLFLKFDLKVPAKKKPAKDKPAAKKTKLTLKDLIFQKYVLGKGQNKVAKPVKIKKKTVNIPEAPPFVTGFGKKETERIRGLLFLKFDLKVPAKKKPAKDKPAAKKAKLTIKDLIFKKFDTGTIKPVVMERTTLSIPQAPPFISGYDVKETEKIKALLFKAFDLRATPAEVAGQVPSKPAPASTSPAIPPYEPVSSTDGAGTEQMSKAMRMGLCALALLIAVIVGTSFSNRSKFYLQEFDNGVEVWRGKFAPSGMELVYKLDGVKVPNPLRESYSKKEISPILFDFFLDKADTVLNVPAGPDIPKMKAHLRQAADFAPSQAFQNQIERRLKSIDFIIAFHKADVALSKGTASDLRTAKSSLASAYASATTDYQRELVVKTQTAVDEATAALKAK